MTINVAADVAKDTADNNNEAATQASVTVDKERPTVAISDLPSGEENDAFDLTITFSEDVSGFTKEDLLVTGEASATAVAAVSGSDSTYTATITPNADKEGNVTVRVRGMAAMDDAGNDSTVSTTTSAIRIDTIDPTAVISSEPTGEQNSAFTITITFSEDVNDFAKEDLTVTGEASATAVAAVGGSESTYTATITPNANKEGNVRVSVKANGVTDDAGNGNPASAASTAVHIDTIAPTPTITGPTTPQNGAFDVTIDFGEPVSAFLVSELTVTGATKAANWKSAMNGPRRYRMTLTPTTADGSTGTVTIDVAEDVAEDNAGNDNEAATQVSVPIDKKKPTLTITPPTKDQKEAFDVTFTFNEDVTDFMPSDVSVSSNARKANSWKSGATATTYKLTLTPNGITAGNTGTVTINVAADVAKDTADNNNTAATQASVTVDKERPTVAISRLSSGEENEAFNLTITFSEDVSGFTKEDLLVTGEASATAVAAVGASESTYTATITPNANKEGDVTVRVRGMAAMDEAGNTSTVSAITSAIHIDTIAPDHSGGFTQDPKNSPFEIVITFTEDVTGFTADDLTLIGPATVAMKSGTQGPRVWTLVFTPNANSEGTLTARIKAGAVTDNAGNDNANAELLNGTGVIDTRPPTPTINAPMTLRRTAHLK